MSLAKTLKGDIIAVDLFEEFLEKLKENSAKENTTANIKTLSASMDKLPLKRRSLTSSGRKERFTISDSRTASTIGKSFSNREVYWLFQSCHGQQTVARKDWKTSGPENMPKWIQ